MDKSFSPSRLDIPPATLADLNQIYLRAANQIIDGHHFSKIKEIISLRSFVSHTDFKISTGACSFLFKLLKLIGMSSDQYQEMLSLIARKAGATNNSSLVIDLVLRVITVDYCDLITESSEARRNFALKYIDIVEDTLYSCPDKGFILLKHLENTKQKILIDLYGSLVVKLLYDQIPLKNVHSFAFWDLLQKHNNLMCFLLLWVKDKDVAKQAHAFSLCSHIERYKEFSALFLTKLFCTLCYEGLNPVGVIEKLYNVVFEVSDSIQSLICIALAFNLKKCACNYAQKYLQLCIDIVKRGSVFKQPVQLLKIELLMYSNDFCYFPEIKSLISQLNDTIDNRLINLNDIRFPAIKVLSSRFIVKRYMLLNESFETLKLLYSFHLNPENIFTWLKRLQKLNNTSNESTNNIINTVFYSLMMYGKDEVKEAVIDALLQFKNKDLFMGYYLFFVEPSPSIKLKIFLTLCSITSSRITEEEADLLENMFQSFTMSNINSEVGVTQNITFHMKNPKNIRGDGAPDNNSRDYTIGRVIVLGKLLKSNGSKYLEECLPELNEILNKWLLEPDGSLIVSLVIDCLTCLCENRHLFVESLWDEISQIISINHSDCVLRSFCKFLSIVPACLSEKHLKRKNHSIVSNSVCILWNLIVEGSPVSKDAIEALACFNIESFDRMILSCDHCNSGDTEDEEYRLLRGAIPEACWLHLIQELTKDDCIALFTRLIKKQKKYPPTHQNNYFTFFRALLMYLQEAVDDGMEYFDPENEPLTDICLSLLNLRWLRTKEDFTFLGEFYESCDDLSIQNRILGVLISNSYSKSAHEQILKLITNDKLKPEHMSSVFLNLDIVIDDFYPSEVTKKIIFQGLHEMFKEDYKALENRGIMSSLKNHDLSPVIRQIIVSTLLIIWEKNNFGKKQFNVVNEIIAKYDQDFIVRVPLYSMEAKDCQKYVELYTKNAIHTKLLCNFETCIDLSSKIPRLKRPVLHNLIKLLDSIGNDNLKSNRLWLLNFISKLEHKRSNFYFMILALCLDSLTGTTLLAPGLCFPKAIDHLPLSIKAFYEKNEPLGLQVIIGWQKITNLHPAFKEAFKVAAMMLCDSSIKIDYSQLVTISSCQ